MTELPLPAEWIERMKSTFQNPLYHAEGDVYSHSQLVLDRFQELKKEFELTAEEETILYWASILHDIGKTVTTQEISGVWRSPGHEIAGVPIARDFLLSIPGISGYERRSILDLVRWHFYPFWWMRKSRDENELRLFSTRVDIRLLSIFSIMDISGRRSVDLDESVELTRKFHSDSAAKIRYEWGTYAELQQKFSSWSHKLKSAAWSAYRLNNAGLIGRLLDQPNSPDSPPVMRTVNLMIGPAFSGKSSYISKNHPGGFAVNLDDFMIGDHFEADAFSLDRRVTEFGYLLSVYSSRHPEVFVEGHILNPAILEKLNRVIRSQNVKLRYFLFESKLADLVSRAKANNSLLTESDIRSHYNRLSAPHPWEAHEIRWVGNES